MKSKKSLIKKIIYIGIAITGTTIFSLGVSLACNADLGKWTQVVINTPGQDLTAGQIAGISFLIGLVLGVTALVWYPISRFLAWAKTRTLKNKNLEMDLKLKEQQLDQNSNKE